MHSRILKRLEFKVYRKLFLKKLIIKFNLVNMPQGGTIFQYSVYTVHKLFHTLPTH